MNLPLMEDFYSIQGEGFYQGAPAYFLRLAGCDVGCVWCDVKASWDASAYPRIDVPALTARASASGASIVIVTGGEPVMYNLEALTEHLHRAGLRTHLETSGAYPITGVWDWVCLSPKKFKPALESAAERADELKVIVYNQSDFAFGEMHAARVRPECKLFLQPEWSREKEMLPLMVDYVKDHPRWTLSLQIHKYLNVR